MKLGIVAEGGASRTFFTCGVLDAFLEEDIMCDYYIGVSAGIANGVSYLSKQKKRNIDIGISYMRDKRYMGMRHLLKEKNFYNVDFVFNQIPNKLYPFDYEAFRNYPGKVEAAVTNVHTGKAEYMEVPRDDGRFDVVVASCALPVFFQPVKIGRRYYLDGGVADPIPFKHALEDEHCDKLIVIQTREKEYIKKPEIGEKITAALYHKYPHIIEDVQHRAENYNRSLAELLELEREGKVFVIAPKSTFGAKRTASDPEVLQRLYDEGYAEALEQMDALRAYLRK